MSLADVIEKTFGIKSRERKLSEIILKLTRLERDTTRQIAYLEGRLDQTYIIFKEAKISGASEQVLMALASRYYMLELNYGATKNTKLYITSIVNAYSVLKNHEKILELCKNISSSAGELDKTRCVVKVAQSSKDNKLIEQMIEQIAKYDIKDNEAEVKKMYETLCARVDAELAEEAKKTKNG